MGYQITDSKLSKKVNTSWILPFLFAALIFGYLLSAKSVHAEAQDSELVTVTYLSYGGNTNATYNALSQVVEKGSKIKIPAVPPVTNYQSMGWALSKGSASANYTPGMEIAVTKDITLYSAYKILPCAVVFTNNSGRTQSTLFSNLNKRVAVNATIQLPKLPTYNGYTSLGWATTVGATTPKYKAGEKVRITKSTKFYGVYRKNEYCTVSFYYGNGKYDSAYLALKMKVIKGKTVTLPAVPARTGYYNSGWATTMNASKVVGATYKISSNMKFYAVQKRALTINLRNNTGSLYKSVSVGIGDAVVLPTVMDTSTYTFMGWSTSPGQSVNPTYPAGQRITFKKSINLYAVLFPKNSERVFKAANIYKLDTRKYRRAIFIGDSRTNRMRNTLDYEFGSGVAYPNVSFIAGEGMGINWFQDEGYTELLKNIKKYGAGTTSKPIAVVINLGVNDLKNIDTYISAMKALSTRLSKYNCKMFYMSVNPINSRVINSRTSTSSRTEYSVLTFNSKIRSGLAGKFTYIDTFSHLMKNGVVYDTGRNGAATGIDDGLHYSPNTYKRIYDVAITKINASK
ncbi:MAG: InlB B-repeat-containing protein [Eubacteriales bacterium]|nr:InlB B-repeat-containing protein [Eubacteriales bacterium]